MRWQDKKFLILWRQILSLCVYINVSHRGLRLQVCHLWTKEVVCHLWRARRGQLWWGPPYTSHEVGAFLSAWGVQHRVSSARYPQSNGRAELSVKTAKRLIYDNTKHGSLDTDSFVRALLQHRNTPLQEIGHSPAELLYGRPLRDHLPHPVDMAKIRPEWLAVASDRELALAKRNTRNATAFNERNRTKDLPSLCSGDIVAVQNQSGPSPGRWDRTGIVREVRPNIQYSETCL